MAGGQGSELGGLLGRAVGGDARALEAIRPVDQSELLDAARARATSLVVSRGAVIGVLEGLSAGSMSPLEAQAWASFVRCGFVAPSASGPIRPLNIECEAAWEDEIVEAVSRLDEIGDAVDGEVGVAEIRGFLKSLGAPVGE